MYQKIGILAVLTRVLLSGTLLATPILKVVNAQGESECWDEPDLSVVCILAVVLKLLLHNVVGI